MGRSQIRFEYHGLLLNANGHICPDHEDIRSSSIELCFVGHIFPLLLPLVIARDDGFD